jgi:hypothetical protein
MLCLLLLGIVKRNTPRVLFDTRQIMVYSSSMNTQKPLPQTEIEFLDSLAKTSTNDFHSRLRALWEAGWSLSVLGNAVSPKRPRATIHYWVRKASLKSLSVPIPSPEFTRSLSLALASEVEGKTRTIAPTVTPEVAARLASLSLQARRYRSRTTEGNRFAVANREFTVLCKELRSQGVPAVDIAQAAGISYRAVARRIAK